MEIDKLSAMALNDNKKLKLILKANTEIKDNQKIGVVSVVYITEKPGLAKK